MAEANYYLKNAAETKMYRLLYETETVGETTTYRLKEARMTGSAQPLPDGSTFTGIDIPADYKMILVDLVLGNVAGGAGVTDYRELVVTLVQQAWS